MDERLRISLWMLGGGGFGGVLGSIFGALAAALLYARSGETAGTHLARRMVENFLQMGERQPFPMSRAALIGAVDGFLFLSILGLVGGALLGMSGQKADELLVPMVAGSALLASGAIFFGTLAYALTYHTAEVLYAVVGGYLGSFFAVTLLGPDYGLAGLIPGLCLGLVLCRSARRYSPKFQPPHTEKSQSQPRSGAGADITGSPPSPSDDDFFHKPD
jgi:hypothetical protein